MDPTLANADLAPPRPPVLVRGLLPALLAHAVLAVALTSGLQWKRTPDASRVVNVPGLSDPAADARLGITGVSPQAAAPAMDATTPVESEASVAAATNTPPTPTTGAEPRERIAMGAGAAPASVSTRGGPSFDCSKARSAPERIICADAELSQLDRDLGRLYARAKSSAPDAADFRRENELQWKLRESTCRDRECLVAWYAQRRGQLLARLDETAAARSR